jgi:hypothetical protein
VLFSARTFTHFLRTFADNGVLFSGSFDSPPGPAEMLASTIVSLTLWPIMGILARIAAGALVFFGVVHAALTTRNYQINSAEALWFAGTGIMLIAAGLLTLCASMPAARMARVSSIIVNLLGFTLAVLAVPVIQQPHVYLLILFFVLALIGVSALIIKTPS